MKIIYKYIYIYIKCIIRNNNKIILIIINMLFRVEYAL